MTDAVPEDNAEAPAKDSFEEEVLGGTAGADGLSDTLATTDGGGGTSSLIIINITQQISITAILRGLTGLLLSADISASNRMT